MDTKLKKFKQNMSNFTFGKVIAFIICVGMFTTFIVSSALLSMTLYEKYDGDMDSLLQAKSYEESNALQYEFSDKLERILLLIKDYKSEEYIKSGVWISQSDEYSGRLSQLYYDKRQQIEESWEISGNETNATVVEGNQRRWTELNMRVPEDLLKFETAYPQETARIKQEIILDKLREFKEIKQYLKNEMGFSYYVSDGQFALSSIDGFSTSNPSATPVDPTWFNEKYAYLSYEKNVFTKHPKENTRIRGVDESLKSRLDSEYNENLTVYMAFDNEFIGAKQVAFSDARNDVLRWIPLIGISFGLTLISFIYLIMSAGRRDEKGNIIFMEIDRWFMEIHLAIILFCFIGGGVFAGEMMMATRYYDGYVYTNLTLGWTQIGVGAAVGFIATAIGLVFFLSMVRNMKGKKLIRRFFCFRVVRAIAVAIREVYYGGSTMRKVVLVVVAFSLISGMTWFFSPIVAIIAIILVVKWVRKYDELKKGVREMRNGKLNYQIPLDGRGEFDELARDINAISKGFDVAVQNELKNQRLKTELISNVSHDIKTPLTSIITYVDLLKKEGLDSPDAPKYLDILDQKSIRLKILTEDLFEAAKASSGAMSVNFERVELIALIEQGLGELSHKIESSGLEFKVNAEEAKYYVRADGQLLWRIIENLLSNVLKYAQEHSRVYIDVKRSKDKVIMEVKNISMIELNIPADELMERFKRGDESRTTEGSGLGLSIAKDLARIQEGQFEIKIDGDLFKAIVTLAGDAPDK